MANASVATPTVATDRPSVLNGMKRPPMAGKLHRYATQRPRKTNGHRLTPPPGSHFRERRRSWLISAKRRETETAEANQNHGPARRLWDDGGKTNEEAVASGRRPVLRYIGDSLLKPLFMAALGCFWGLSKLSPKLRHRNYAERPRIGGAKSCR